MKIDINKLYSNLKSQGLDETSIKDIVNKIKNYDEYIDATNLENEDYINILKALEYAHFCEAKYVSPESKTKGDSLLIYSDDDVKIWNPRTFEQSSLIGLPIWCICFNEGYWNEHVNIRHETIYMVYNVLEDSVRQYTCCLVSPNGQITIYDREHNELDGIQVLQYLNTLGSGKQYLKPLELQENKQYRNMKQKKPTKINEGKYVVQYHVGTWEKRGGYGGGWWETKEFDNERDAENFRLKTVQNGQAGKIIQRPGPKLEPYPYNTDINNTIEKLVDRTFKNSRDGDLGLFENKQYKDMKDINTIDQLIEFLKNRGDIDDSKMWDLYDPSYYRTDLDRIQWLREYIPQFAESKEEYDQMYNLLNCAEDVCINKRRMNRLNEHYTEFDEKEAIKKAYAEFIDATHRNTPDYQKMIECWEYMCTYGFPNHKVAKEIEEIMRDISPYERMKQKQAIRINESQVNSLLKGMLNESYKDRCKIVGMYAFVQFFKQHPEKLQTLEPKWKERYEELCKYFDEHPLGMEMQAIYRREWPQLQGKQTIKLNESLLRQAIKESIKKVLMEDADLFDDYYQGRGFYKDFNDYVQRLYDKLELEAVQQGIYSVDEYVRKITGNKYKTFNDAVSAEEWRRYRNHVSRKQQKAYDPMEGHNTDNPNYVTPIKNVNVNDTIYPAWSRPYGYYNDLLWKDHDKDEKEQQRKDDANMKRALAAADNRPLHRKGSLNRGGNVKLNESQLRKMIKESIMKVLKESETPIVIGDEDCGDLYSVAMSNGDYSSVVFNVYCYSAQDALDEAVDYAENQGWNGLFDDEDEEAINEFPEDYITAGNHGHYLRIDSFVVRKV